MSIATTDDVTARSLRALTDVELMWATTALEDVEAMLETRIPDLLTRAEIGTPFHRLVIQVEAAAVLRVLRNPDGVLEESGDDYRRRLDAAVSTGQLYISEAEFARLATTTTGAAPSQAFTITPFAGYSVEQPDPWIQIS